MSEAEPGTTSEQQAGTTTATDPRGPSHAEADPSPALHQVHAAPHLASGEPR